MSKFAEAENKIAAILKQLEIDTGMIVKSVSLEGIDVTGLADDRRKVQQIVRIEAERTPGNNWG